ncbi:substrate-binding periplasmic protein [Metapseudomonas furukawaii]|uniref:Periplasmic binding protein, putative n=1 Tax=Metapseudomonas furukawaii TaxID=1149133 RepID=A0AAD1FDU6_METFU|nr:transporter substrate-binding domain-containing protein [Pseudomonas furukawaii]ELS24699.1 extracellular solute-binding protein, family 3 [Pseudomonas furukawaii]BAU72461.1 periplasmic binding protein, putative [Pseudomonas furukawaii]
MPRGAVLWSVSDPTARAGRRLAGLLGAWMLAGLASAQQPAPLKVMTDYWPPFRIAGDGGRLQGLDMDLLAELERRTGLRFDVRRAPWSRGLAALERGSADLMTGLARTPERERYIDYLERPYFSCAPRFYIRPDVAPRVTGYGQLAGYDIGFVLGSAYFEPFDSDPALRKVGVSGEGQLLEMLQRKRLQLVIGTDCQVDYELLRNPKLAGRIVKLAYRPPARTELFVGFSRQRVLAPQRDAIAQALGQMLDEGWVLKAAQRYSAGAQ